MAATRIAAEDRPLDAIAIDAGIGDGGEFSATPLDSELNLVDLNVRSTVHLTKRVLPRMIERGEGKMLFTSSDRNELLRARRHGGYEGRYGIADRPRDPAPRTSRSPQRR